MTNRKIKGLKPDKRTNYPLGDGLVLRVTKGGKTKSFSWTFRRNGRQSSKEWLTLGTFPTLTVDAARAKAQAARQTLREGGEPGAVEKTPARQDADAMTVSELGALWLAYSQPPLLSWRTVANYTSMFHNYVVPLWGSRPVTQIKPGDVYLQLEQLAAAKNTTAKRVFSALSALLSYGVRLQDTEPRLSGLTRNRLKGLSHHDKPGKPTDPRERTLSDPELKSLLATLDTHGRDLRTSDDETTVPWLTAQRAAAHVVLLHILTGQRKQELLAMRWQDIGRCVDGTPIWTIPGEDTKNGKPHQVPITPTIERVLVERGLHTDARQHPIWVFPNPTGTGPLGDPKGAVHTIYKLAGITWGQADGTTQHDLRRTVNRRLRSLQYHSTETGKLLNHMSARDFNDRVYNGNSPEDLASDLALKRRMLEDWHYALHADVIGDEVAAKRMPHHRWQKRAAA